MNAALRQLRVGIRCHIFEASTVITPMRRALVDDGFGGQIPSGTASAQPKARVRLQHESGSVQSNTVKPAGLDTNLSLYVLTDHRAPLEEGDTFSALGYTWTVGPVNSFSRHGGVYKTEAPLVKGSAVPVTIPGAFAALAISNTEIDLTWTDTGAVNTYQIERKTGEGDFALIASPAAGALVFHDTGLESETEYTYRMHALSGAIPSAYTEEASATTDQGAPA
jgi:hypothetical protein